MALRGIYFLTFLLTSLVSFSQTTADTLYYDRSWNPTSSANAGYYRVISKAEKDTLWHFRDFYAENDQLQNKGTLYQKNPKKRHGTFVWFYKDGTKQAEGDFDHDQRTGLWYTYHENGAKDTKGDYKKGNRNGQWEWYYPNGALRSRATYDSTGIEGERKWWYRDSTLKSKAIYEDGKLHGEKITFYPDGSKKSVARYQYGQLDGTKKEWYKNDTLKAKMEYEAGILLEDDAEYYTEEGDSTSREEVFKAKADYNLLWKITGNGLKEPSWLFGTMHVTDPRAFEFSDTLINAFNTAEAYSMEIHPDDLLWHQLNERTDVQDVSLRGAALPQRFNKTTLGTHWNTSYHWRVNLNQLFYRPRYFGSGQMPYFLDVYLFDKALKQGKKTYGLEDIEEHINAGRNLPHQDKQFDILTRFNPREEMMDTYQEGNIEKIGALMDFFTGEEFRYRLLIVRNYIMAETIDSLVQEQATFNTCGSGHLPGDEGVVELLREKGYTVKAVRGAFKGDSIQADSGLSPMQWKDIAFKEHRATYKLPANAIVHDAGENPMAYAINWSDHTAYHAGVLDLRFDTTLARLGVSNPDKFMEKFYGENLDYIQQPEKITFNDLSGFEITLNQNHSYTRLRVLESNGRMYLQQVVSDDKKQLSNEHTEHFFSGFTLEKNKAANVTTEEINSVNGAFKATFPATVEYTAKKIPVEEQSYLSPFTLHHYEGITPDDHQYFIAWYDMETGNYFDTDSLWIDDIEYSLKQQYGDPESSEELTTNQLNGKAWEFNPSEDHKVYARLYIRGNRNYIITARVGDERNARKEAETFLQDFAFTPLAFSFNPEIYTSKAFSFVAPFKMKDETQINNYHWDKEKHRYVIDPDDVQAEQSYTYHFNSYSSDAELYDREKYAEHVNEMKLTSDFGGQDSLSGAQLIVGTMKFSPYYYMPDADSLFSKWVTSRYDVEYMSAAYDTTYLENGVWARKGLYTSNHGSLALRFQGWYDGHQLIRAHAYMPEELLEKDVFDTTFASISPEAKGNIEDIFTHKAEKLLSDLSEKDTVQQAKASGALSFYFFEEKHLPMIYKQIIAEQEDTTDFIDNTYQLINELSMLKDDSTFDFLIHFYHNHTSTWKQRLEVLDAMSNATEDEHLKQFIGLLADTSKIESSDNYRIQRIFYALDDSLEQVARLYPVFHDSLFHIPKYQSYVTAIAKKITRDSASLAKDVLAPYDTAYLSAINAHIAAIDTLEDNYYSDYSKHKGAIDNLLTILKTLDAAKDIQESLYQLAGQENEHLREMALITLLENDFAIDDDLWETIFDDVKKKFSLYLSLKEKALLNKLPEKYKLKENIMEDELKHHIHEEQGSGGTIEKLKKTGGENIRLEGKKYIVYTYEYYFNYYGRTRYVAVTSPQPKDADEYDFDNAGNSLTLEYEYGDKRKKLIRKLIKELKEEKEKELAETSTETAE